MKTLTGNRVVPRSIKNQSGTNTIAVDLLLNQNCIVTNNGNLIVTGDVSGSRGFTITGSGTMDLKGDNTYTGQTVIKSGTLKIADTATFGTNGNYAGFFLNNGIFDYSAPGDLTLSGNNDRLSKTKPAEANPNPLFIMNGSGRLTWDFFRLASFFDGTIQVNSGYFRIGSGSNNGGTRSLKEIQIGSSGTLEFNRNDGYDATQSFILSGSGNIVLMDGSLTLAGINTFSGTVTINSLKTLTLQRKLNASFVNNGTLVLNVTTDPSYWDTTLANFSKTHNSNQLNYVLSTDYSVATNSGSGDVTAEVQSAGFGDDPSEFSGFTSGKIALLQRSATSFQTKINNAISAGASAVIIYNNTTGLFTPSLTTSSIPVIGTTQSIGQEILDNLNNGSVTVNVKSPSNFVVFDNVISGNGSLTKSGSGTLVISSSNSYTGSTSITNAGVVRITNSSAFGNSSSVAVANSGACLELSGGITLDRNLTIGGTGVSSGGIIRNVSGNNTHDGSITMTSASRINSDAGTTLTLGPSGTFTGNFQATFGGSGDFIINKSLGNGGQVTKDGSGTLVLNTANSYTTTSISAGTVKINGSGKFGSGAVTNNSSIVFETDNNSEILNAISGTGSIVKNLNVETKFSATLSHTGTTTINQGTFTLFGSGGFSGSTGNIVIGNQAVFKLNKDIGTTTTIIRNIGGEGSVLVEGAGLVNFTGNLTHTGGTTIQGTSTLSVGNAGTVGSISGNITNNSNLQFSRTDTITYSGVISGTGTLTKASSGTLILTSENTYTGDTLFSVNNSGVLRLSHANALGNSSSTISVRSGCVIELTNGITFSRNLSSAGTGVSLNGSLRNISGDNTFTGSYTLTAASQINSDSGTLTIDPPGSITGAFALTLGGSGNIVVNRSIANSGNVSKSGTGSLTLSAACSYTGTTTITNGPVKLVGAASFGSSTVSISSPSVVTFELNDNSTIPNSISGSGFIVKNLNVKTIFTGTLSQTGTTTINEGTFAIGAGGTTGSVSGATGDYAISSGAVLEINRSNANTFTRGTSGSGSVIILGGGTTTLSGNFNHTGDTTISAGTLNIGGGGSTGFVNGNIVNNSSLTFNRNDTYTYSATISGSGSLTKDTSVGILILSGNNTYTGNTTINGNGGVIRLSGSNALGNSALVTVLGGGALELTNNITVNRNISLSGTGQSSGGSLRNRSGDNTITGSVAFAGGTCPRINSDSGTLFIDSSGSMTTTCTWTFGGAGNISVARPITSTAPIVKDGVGTLILSGANTSTGTITINAGTVLFSKTQSLYNSDSASWVKTKIIVNTGATFAINVGGANEFTTSNVTTLLTNLLTTINNNGLRSGSSIGFDTTNSSSDFTISNNISDSTGTGSGAVGVVKLGTNTLVLSGTSTYSGGTTINGGTLKAGSASCFGSGTITVNSGATLDKSGFSIANTVVNNGGTVID